MSKRKTSNFYDFINFVYLVNFNEDFSVFMGLNKVKVTIYLICKHFYCIVFVFFVDYMNFLVDICGFSFIICNKGSIAEVKIKAKNY